MAYAKQKWYDNESGGTAITAERLNHMEDGIGVANGGAVLVGDIGDIGKLYRFGSIYVASIVIKMTGTYCAAWSDLTSFTLPGSVSSAYEFSTILKVPGSSFMQAKVEGTNIKVFTLSDEVRVTGTVYTVGEIVFV